MQVVLLKEHSVKGMRAMKRKKHHVNTTTTKRVENQKYGGHVWHNMAGSGSQTGIRKL